MSNLNKNILNKLNLFFAAFNNLSVVNNFNFINFKKLISKRFKISVFSVKYNYYTRYIEQATALPSRWSKSFLRESFAKNEGKYVDIATLKTKECFFINDYDFVLCLADNERVSAEISHGNNQIYNFKEIKKIFNKKKIKTIKNGIVFLHPSTYNIWHHYVEVITIVYHFITKFKNTKKKIFIPYNKDSLKILKLLNIEDKVILFDNKQPFYSKNCEFFTGIFDEVLPISSMELCKKAIIKSISEVEEVSSFKNIFISRGDNELNRRNLVNEKAALSIIMRKYSNLHVYKPGKEDIHNNISKIINSKNIFSLMGTQLYFNVLFCKNPKRIFEIVGENYHGFTVGELVSKFLKCKYIRLNSKNFKQGYSIYEDQLADIKNLKKKI